MLPVMAPRDWSNAHRIVCVRLDTLGDVLMTTPAVRALREARVDRHIALLTSPAGSEAARLVPEIDEVIEFAAPWMKATSPDTEPGVDVALIDRLRAGRFDAAVIFTVFSQSPLPAAYLCHLAGIPLRLAYCRENPYRLLSTWLPEPDTPDAMRHEVRRQLDLVAAIGAVTDDERLSLSIPRRARASVTGHLARLGLSGGAPWAVVHPGASAASRRYPPELFAAAARLLRTELGLEVVFTGSASERPLVESIRDMVGLPSHSLAGELDLAELAALVDAAPLLVANNTGPVHVAAAVGTPVVDLYALTNPQHTPWQVPNRVLSQDVPCRNCFRSVCPMGHHDCLRLIPPSAVLEAARDLLAAPVTPASLLAASR